MKYVSFLLFEAMILVIVCLAQLFGAVSFVHEKTFTVPGVAATGQSPVFTAAFPGDNSVLLACDSTHAVLYSVTRDSVLYQFYPGSGFKVRAATFADANRDSVLDVIIASNHIVDPYVDPQTTVWKLTAYNGASHFAVLSRDSMSSIGSGACILKGVCLGSDPRPRVLFSHGITTDFLMWGLWIDVEEFGVTFLYNQFPAGRDSLGTYITDVSRLPDSTGTQLPIVSTYVGWFHEVGNPDQYYSSSQIGVLTSEPDISSLNLSNDSNSTGNCRSSGNYFSHTFACAGNIFSSSGTDIVVGHSYRFSCSSGAGPADTGFSYSQLECWSTSNGVATTVHWAKDLAGTSFTNFTYHPLLPGFFFAFSGDTLLLFRGSDGSIRDRITTSVPSGDKHWEYLDNDSVPRLIVVNGTSVSIYHLDITTDIADQTRPVTVPSHFGFEEPYPNPFNPTTTLSVRTGIGGKLTLEIFNVKGQRVALLFDGAAEPNRVLQFYWDATGHASGVYFARASLAEGRAVKKLLLLK